MSGRRNGNPIRGPKSALTDFLAVSLVPPFFQIAEPSADYLSPTRLY